MGRETLGRDGDGVDSPMEEGNQPPRVEMGPLMRRTLSEMVFVERNP